MAETLVEKILGEHLVEGELAPGNEIGLRIDQTLTQDATGTTAYLLFEAMGVERVKTELSVSYVDHNMTQFGPENHNDHLYLQSVARKAGAYHSRPGNGICHQVHFERFARPGRTLIGSDSHTPTGGGMGMVAMGAGGLDVAVAMGGGAFYTTSPQIIGVELRGSMQPWVSSKDIILKLLSILSTKGNVGSMVEYFGEGIAALDAPSRATCANMGAELGVTASVFPSDEQTRLFLAAQGREDQYTPLAADPDAVYGPVKKLLNADEDSDLVEIMRESCTDFKVGQRDGDDMVEVTFGHVVIDLDSLEPMAAGSPSPGNISTVASLAGTKVGQVVIGSCTNSSYRDLMVTAAVLKGRTVHPDVELGIAPGSRQVLSMLAENGALTDIVQAGARILESGCGPCIGQGFSPAEGAVSLRTFNRNFAGRTGTTGDMVYLTSPETAIAAALTGEITRPVELDMAYPEIANVDEFRIDDNMLQPPLPEDEARGAEIVRGSTIVKPPSGSPLPENLDGEVVIKVGDKITTDHIMPAGALLKYRSNVPEYAKYVFDCYNSDGEKTFADRSLEAKDRGEGAIIVAGDSYGQGSSREHAALCPMYLGVRAVIARRIERIHQANLVNFAILPLTFSSSADYESVQAGDKLRIVGTSEVISSADKVAVENVTQGTTIECNDLLPRTCSPGPAPLDLLPWTCYPGPATLDLPIIKKTVIT